MIAETFVAMPFLVISVEGALRAADARFEDVAATLGADRWTTFRRVTLPLVAPGIAAGAVLCWARALGEFGATITFAGNFPGTTQTMPLAVYLALQRDPEAAIVLSLVLLAVSLVDAAPPARPLARPGGAVTLDASIAVRRGSLDLAVDLAGGRRRGARRARARTAPASPRSCGCSPACCSPTAAASPSTARTWDDGADAPAPAPAAARRGLPGLAALPAPERRRQRGLRAAHPRDAQGARPATAAAEWLTRVGLDGLGGPAARPSSPAGRPSGRRWPGRSSATRRCCCSTSRCRRWTPAPGSPSAPNCAVTWRSSAAARCW